MKTQITAGFSLIVNYILETFPTGGGSNIDIRSRQARGYKSIHMCLYWCPLPVTGELVTPGQYYILLHMDLIWMETWSNLFLQETISDKVETSVKLGRLLHLLLLSNWTATDVFASNMDSDNSLVESWNWRNIKKWFNFLQVTVHIQPINWQYMH